MTPHDINRTLAEFMGWHLEPAQRGWQYWHDASGSPIRISENLYASGAPDPTLDAFDPYGNSNHLREVLAKLTDDQWDHLLVGLVLHQDAPKSDKPFWQWMLTCDPSIIAQAVAEVVRPDTPAATAPSLDRAPQS